ncbi:MAG: glutamate formiminotransferase [Acidimicrobiales bacterium]|jgi:glutamate formiminotransferase
MLECVVNISEGRDAERLDEFVRLVGTALLDLHADASHNRSVFTLAGPETADAARQLARVAVAQLDIARHRGIHPRLGVVDVVPFVPLGPDAMRPDADLDEAIAARDLFARWAADELGVPCFLYGPERALPEIRRHAFADLVPDFGPVAPHPSAGASCVGARPVLVAYNLWLAEGDLDRARHIASTLRGPEVRTASFAVGAGVQVSCNLVAPWSVGPADVYDRVAGSARIERAELVGLVPEQVLRATPARRWATLDLGEDSTIEARLADRGFAMTA